MSGFDLSGRRVLVTGASHGNVVILNRGSQRITLNCAGQRCEPTPMPGDGKEAYDPANGVAAAHQSAARTAAAAGAAVEK